MTLYNPYIVIPFVVWGITQLAKFVVAAVINRNRLDFRYLYASGGMPSAHSAVVCSLAVTAWLRLGFNSPIFGLSVIMAAIVMYDSFGVRRAAGEQAAAINAILDSMSRQKLGLNHQRLREILGHKPLEVTVGAFSGIVLAILFNASYASQQMGWLSNFPGRNEALLYLGLSGLLIVTVVVLTLILRSKYPGSAAIRRFTKNLLIKDLSLGIAGLLLSFAGYQHAAYLGWRGWIYLLGLILLIWAAVVLNKAYRELPGALANEAEKERIGKWLPARRKRAKRG